ADLRSRWETAATWCSGRSCSSGSCCPPRWLSSGLRRQGQAPLGSPTTACPPEDTSSTILAVTTAMTTWRGASPPTTRLE
ncbi:unnamed protein product, partial [Tetraodon nigroviridis]